MQPEPFAMLSLSEASSTRQTFFHHPVSLFSSIKTLAPPDLITNMQLSYLLALLGASRIAWAAPVANNDQVESASGDLEERFYYTHYDPKKRDEELEKRFYYTKYDLEKRDEDLDKRFFYTHYDPKKRDEDLEKRFYYTKYDLEKRDE
ncbi:hypothetical protein GB937_008942 [Aspergillus fischeri]|nr:hypothetical protein GB937_008942 [Aspergillus fischeri]